MQELDPGERRQLYTTMGKLEAGVSHILAAIDRTSADHEVLRKEVGDKIAGLDVRVGALEKFQVRIVTLVGVVVPVVTMAVQWGVPLLLNTLKGL